ncbi:hypothetical protein [Streptomyces sp. NBC_00096]|uniref:hypothetical protein n=1 Tax=Streptomyces sp. NBC_00096 TaxID=2975650 RepID=UPI00325126C7
MPEGDTIVGLLFTGANVIGLSLIGLLMATTDADASTRVAVPAATVPDREPAEEQSPAGTTATAITSSLPELPRDPQARSCRCSRRPALPQSEGG